MSDSNNSKFSDIENPEKFLPIVHKAVDLAVRKGADFADAGISLGREVSIGVDNSSIKSSEANLGNGFSVRVFVNGGMGFASTNGLVENQLETLVEKAVELAKVATPDLDFIAIPEAKIAAKIPIVFDPTILSLGPDDVIGWVCDNIKAAKGVSENVIVSGDAGFGISASVLASSTGVSLARKSTTVHCGFFCVVKDGDLVGSFADHSAARFFSDFKPNGLGEKITRQALKYQGAKKVKTGLSTIVLSPICAYGLMSGLVDAAGAEAIQRRRSMLADKLGETVATSILSITDNGLIDGGLSSGAYDGEGALKQIVKIFENGKFNAQLHNSYTANKAGVENTGHGSRTRGIAHSNLEIALGQKTGAELIREVDDGIYLELGGLDPDLASGDISTNLDFAFRIENGEITTPVADTMVAGDLHNILMNIDAISSDYREEPGVKMPTMRIRNVQLSSGGE